MTGSPLHGIEQFGKAEQAIVKTDLVGKIRIQANTEFLVPLGCSRKILFLQRIQRIHSESDIRKVKLNYATVIILAMVGAYRKVILSFPGFRIGYGRTQLVLVVPGSIPDHQPVELSGSCVYISGKIGSWPCLGIHRMTPLYMEGLGALKFILDIPCKII